MSFYFLDGPSRRPQPDLALLQRQIDWAADEDAKRRAGQPSRWNQGRWDRCIAGHTARDLGWRPFLFGMGWAFRLDGFRPRLRPVECVAREGLGLTSWQATHLFDGWNDLYLLRRIAADITSAAGS